MPRYQYTDVHERVLTGLAHGVNASVTRDGEPLDEQGTVVARLGDEITTNDPYEHAFLALLDKPTPRRRRGQNDDTGSGPDTQE
jgi:hypothetical protein